MPDERLSVEVPITVLRRRCVLRIEFDRDALKKCAAASVAAVDDLPGTRECIAAWARVVSAEEEE